MKKLITGILALLSCFAFAAGCTDDDSSLSLSTDTNTESSDTSSGDEQDDPLTAAKDFLYADMLDDSNKSTRKNYTVKNTYYSFHADKDFTVTVSVDVTEGVTVEAGETDWTVKIDQALENDLAYVLTVTISDGESSVSFNLNRTALKAPSVVPQEITEKPVEEKAYKLYMYQVTKNADEYFNGNLDKTGFYLNTSLSREYATDVYVDYVEGSETNFNIYFYEGEVKQYIGVYNSYNDKGYHLTPTFNPEINNFEHITSKTDWATSNTFFTGSYVFTWSETYGTFVTTLANAKYDESTSKDPATITPASVTAFLGTSGTYYTFGGMNVTEIENEDTCVGKLVEMVDKNAVSAENKVATEKQSLKKSFTFTGAVEETLPVAKIFNDVTITWAEKEDGAAVITNGVLTMDEPATDTTFILTATITCGEVSETVDIEVIIYVPPVEISISDALAMTELTAKKYIFTGTVVNVANTKYGNLYITDDNGNTIYVYGLYDGVGTDNDGKGNRYDAMGDNAPVVGDRITLVSAISAHKGTNQLANAIMTEKSAPATASVAVKIETTKRELQVADEIKNAGDVALATLGVKYTDVAITWVSSNESVAVIGDGKVTYTIPSEDTEITLTATFICGQDESTKTTKEFKVTVKAPDQISITPVTAPVADTAYVLYVTMGDSTYYFTGAKDGSKLGATTDIDSAGTVKLVSTGTEGNYYLTVVNGETVSYVGWASSTDSSLIGSTEFNALEDKAKYVWAIDSNGLHNTGDTGGVRYFVFYSSKEDIRLYRAGSISEANVVMGFGSIA